MIDGKANLYQHPGPFNPPAVVERPRLDAE